MESQKDCDDKTQNIYTIVYQIVLDPWWTRVRDEIMIKVLIFMTNFQWQNGVEGWTIGGAPQTELRNYRQLISLNDVLLLGWPDPFNTSSLRTLPSPLLTPWDNLNVLICHWGFLNNFAYLVVSGFVDKFIRLLDFIWTRKCANRSIFFFKSNKFTAWDG